VVEYGRSYAICVVIDNGDGIWSMRISHDAMVFLGEICARRSSRSSEVEVCRFWRGRGLGCSEGRLWALASQFMYVLLY
jgi:hypothetical protein